jgi:hypothetical protein
MSDPSVENELPIESKALTIMPSPNESPGELISHAGRVAAACRQIVLQTACNIQGKKYVKVEGWQSIAIAHGCCASSRDVQELEKGFRAIGEVRRMSDGLVLATAEGFVGFDEKTWGNRDEYAQRAMAQTRAISRACRSAFAHIVVMMEAGLSTTPAEEVPDGGFNDNRPDRPPKPAQKPPVKASQPANGGPSTPGFAERCKAKFIAHVEKEGLGPFAWGWAVNNGVIMDTEVLADGEAAKFPSSLEDFERATAAIETIRQAWTNHQQEVYEKAVLLHEAEKAKQAAAPAKTGFEVAPKNEPWRSLITPFTYKEWPAGTKLGEIDKKALWFWMMAWQPKSWTDKKGQERPPSKKDVEFRKALDVYRAEVAAKYEFSEPKEQRTEEVFPEPEDVPF